VKNDKIESNNKSTIRSTKKNILIEPSKTNYNKNDSNSDASSISKGLIFLGIVLLLTYGLYFGYSSNTPEENIHEDQFRGTGALNWVIPISIIFIFVGAIFLFIDRQMVKLSEFAQEVESGEFEKKVLEELDTK
jgi:hypothetical protein